MTSTSASYGVGYYTQDNLAGVFANTELLGRYKWAKGLGWLSWDGRRWATCAEEVVVEVGRQWVLRRLQQAVDDHRTGKAPDGTHVIAWLKTAQAVGTLRAIVSATKGIAGIQAKATDFDAHPDLLNTPSGVVDLRTGALGPNDPDLLMTRCTRVGYTPGAAHADWTSVLEAIPEDCRPYAQLRYGQAVTGHMTSDDVLLVQQGSGENGKTTVMGGIASALGDYYAHVSHRVILAQPGDHPTELMDLRGARLALIEETPEARRLSVARLKMLVGTPRITARHIRQDSVTFEASHTLIVSTNYTPDVVETDHGTWRRLLLLRYPYRFRKAHELLEHSTDRRGDPGLRDRITRDDAAAAAVLAWLVDGAVTWYALKRVFPEPPARIATDTRAWRHGADQILAYIDDRLLLDLDAHVMTVELLADFNAWLVEHGQHTWSDRVFASRFTGHDELAGKVKKDRIRQKAGLSRRLVGWQAPTQGTPLIFNAWIGVRFRTDTDSPHAAQTPANTGPVPSVPGPNHDRQSQSLTCDNQATRNSRNTEPAYASGEAP